jgi:hypothetical protein
MDTETVREGFTAPDGTPFEVMVPLSHAGAIRCSDRVGGSTWCTASRESSQSFVKAAAWGTVHFILSPLSPRPGSDGDPEAVQVGLNVQDLESMSSHPPADTDYEIRWSSQNFPDPEWEDLERIYGIGFEDLVEVFRKHEERILSSISDHSVVSPLSVR